MWQGFSRFDPLPDGNAINLGNKSGVGWVSLTGFQVASAQPSLRFKSFKCHKLNLMAVLPVGGYIREMLVFLLFYYFAFFIDRNFPVNAAG